MPADSATSTQRKLRVVVAGQVPPPMGGQNVMIAHLLDDLRNLDDLLVDHLAFQFTREFKNARTPGIGKLVEVLRVVLRLVRLRLSGPIDVLIYPPGGPQTVPLLRDLLVLPWVLLLSRHVVLHFHAAGIADRLERRALLPRLAACFYARCRSAIVMTDFNRRDPEACGIGSIHVIPHQIADEFDQAFVQREANEVCILSMGHLCPDKGTPALLEAFFRVASTDRRLILELAGEPLAPYSADCLHRDLDRFGIRDRVRLPGVLRGDEKRQAFGRARLFVFPSVAPYESFGLVLVEAMMWSLPVVATDWRGNRDVLRGAEGAWICRPGVEGLAEALQDALADMPRWGEMGKANRAGFEQLYRKGTGRSPIATFVQASCENRRE